MPQQKRTYNRRPWLLLSFLGLLTQSSCDPCYTLAEKICNCLPPDEKTSCVANLSLGNQHRGYEFAKDSEVCKKTLELDECECEDYLNNKFEKCGLYRPKD